jgi:hypothetical protein
VDQQDKTDDRKGQSVILREETKVRLLPEEIYKNKCPRSKLWPRRNDQGYGSIGEFESGGVDTTGVDF